MSGGKGDEMMDFLKTQMIFKIQIEQLKMEQDREERIMHMKQVEQQQKDDREERNIQMQQMMNQQQMMTIMMMNSMGVRNPNLTANLRNYSGDTRVTNVEAQSNNENKETNINDLKTQND